MKKMSLGLREALQLTLEAIRPLPGEEVPLVESVGRVAASDLYALVDSPSTDVSLKDGYAVLSDEIAHATAEHPVRLRLLGSMAAGAEQDIQVTSGATVRVLSGAPIPKGAEAVVADEFVKKAEHDVLVETFAEHGRNIQLRGSDVAQGDCVLPAGKEITPAMAGLLAAAGHSLVPVYRNPFVGIIGTGDEIVEPGNPVGEGKVYASNIITVAGWCEKYGMQTRMTIAKDDHDALLNALRMLCDKTDAVVTSGGAWTGDHDMVAQVLEKLGWKQVFHRIRIGPGKAVGFGILDRKPVFVLPGGPPSNLMAFLQIALPGLLALSGHTDPGLPKTKARLAAPLTGGHPDWTDFLFGTLDRNEPLPTFDPMKRRSSLRSIAQATAIASIPEGQESVPAGAVIDVQLLV